MKNIIKTNKLFFITFILLNIFKFTYAGVKYTPYLDDYVQYLYYPYFKFPLTEILFGGAGTAYTRPLAAILDIYFWSSFFKAPFLAVVLLSVLFSISGIIFYVILEKLELSPSPLFLVIYTLLPSLSEGTYWISAGTRIVMGLFFMSVSLYFFINNKKLLLLLFSVITQGFYEQISILFFAFSFLIFITSPKKYYKEFLICSFSLLLIGAYYISLGKMSDNSQRLGINPRLLKDLKSNFSSILHLFFNAQFPLYTKGFSRGITLAIEHKSFLWIITLILIIIYLYLLSPKEKSFPFLKKKLFFGIILFVFPALPFLIIKDPWLNFRNIVPSVLGFAIITDGLLSPLLKNKTRLFSALLSFFLCICTLTEIWDYRTVAENDKKIIYEIAQNYNGEKEIYYEIKTEKYLPQTSPYHDHIISITGTDWGLTGTVRAVLKNKDIIVKIK